jgi:hypothetical protein
MSIYNNLLYHYYKYVLYYSKYHIIVVHFNGTACLKNINKFLNTNINSYLETSGGQSSDLYLNVAHFFNASVN